MCLAKAYVSKDGEGRLFFEEVAKMVADGEEMVLYDLMGNKKSIRARLSLIDFMQSRIELEED